MPEAPRYPVDDTGEENMPGYEQSSLRRTPQLTYLLWGAGIVLVVAFSVLHLSGVLGPGGH